MDEIPGFKYIDGKWIHESEYTESGFIQYLRIHFDFDLRSFDILVLSLDTERPIVKAQQDHLRDYRKWAWKAYTANNHQALEGCVELLRVASDATSIFPLAAAGDKHRFEQSARASRPRGRIAVDGEHFSIAKEVEQLAKKTDELGGFLPAADLWSELFSILDCRHLNPYEKMENENPFQLEYNKNDDGGRDSIKFSSFKAMLSKARAAER